MQKTVVIGGGPAGMMAAYAASGENCRVILIERNKSLGKKLLLTGSGKCNYSNENLSPSNYYFGENRSFAQLLEKYDTRWIENFFAEHGMLTDVRDGLLYPRSERSDTVKDLLENLLTESNVEIIYDKKVVKVSKEKEFVLETEDGSVITADKLIIATGGKAYPVTGSDGGGYRLARSLGHEVTFTYPVLTRLLFSDPQIEVATGVRIKAKVSAAVDGTVAGTTEGEIQFNSNSLSGICIFQLSRFVSKPLEEGKKCEIHIDFAPQMSKEEVTSFICEALERREGTKPTDILETMFGKKTAALIVSKTKERYNKPEVKDYAEIIKDVVIGIDSHDSFRDAQCTRGGVRTDEVTDDMESTICKNLYFAGEVLDVDGTCGGYNLHFAFMSGYIAGKKAAEKQ